jgi:dihydrofolate synthase/folylpolyglutamate synthase
VEYVEALRYLQRRDDWERTGSLADAGRWDLRRMRSLLARVGDPQLGRRTVHIAGSKGKGSVASMMASVLQASGERVGLYTSPHLHRFVERIAVDGGAIAPEDFGRLMGGLAPHIEAEDADGSYGRVSTFEALTALGFLAFREAGAAWQVLETGLGGRLDATNVLDETDVCVITSIGLEHTAILGDTVGEIAREKAGIITPGSTVVMAPQREPAADVIRAVCDERGARLIEVAQSCAMNRTGSSDAGQDFAVRTKRATHRLHVPLLGRHQLDNAATAVLTLEALEDIDIDAAALRDGLAKVRWPARIEILKRRPLVVADGAHDRDSMRRLVQTLREDLGRSEATVIIGCSADKNVRLLAAELSPIAVEVIATRSRHPRSMTPERIVEEFADFGVPVAVEDSVAGAVEAALAMTDAGGAIVVCGSLFVAAEAREHVLGIAYDPPLAPADLTEARA